MAFQPAKRRSGKYGRQACHQQARRSHGPSIRQMGETHGRSGESVLSSSSCQNGVTGKWNYQCVGTDFEENKKRPLGSFGRVAFRMNCRYRAPVPFTLWSLPYSWRHHGFVCGLTRAASHHFAGFVPTIRPTALPRAGQAGRRRFGSDRGRRRHSRLETLQGRSTRGADHGI
jgi:hypothetical protein